jgi:hypothetical protein
MISDQGAPTPSSLTARLQSISGTLDRALRHQRRLDSALFGNDAVSQNTEAMQPSSVVGWLAEIAAQADALDRCLEELMFNVHVEPVPAKDPRVVSAKGR